MKDSTKQQIYEACGCNRAAAQLLDYLMNVHKLKATRSPAVQPGSSALWLDFTRADLAARMMVSEKTVSRAIVALASRGFLTVHRSTTTDRTNRYELHPSMIEAAFQTLPLFEEGELVHMDKMSTCKRTKCPVASGQNVPLQGDKMSTCIDSLPIPSHPFTTIRADDDATVKDQSESQATSQADLPPVSEPGPGPAEEDEDADREELIGSMRAIGIAREWGETYLNDHSRQKIRAGLAYATGMERRGRIRKDGSTAGLFFDFLKQPGKHQHELDRNGCWKPVASILREEAAGKARDRPGQKLSPAQELLRQAAIAWQNLDYGAQTNLKDQIAADHPDKSTAARFKLCQEQALALITKEAHEQD